MDDLTSKLMELLANKETLKNLSNLIGENLENIEENSEKKSTLNSIKPQVEESQKDIIPMDAIQTVMKLMPVISSINRDDENTRLLSALRPHLSEKRQVKLDESIKMMQFFKILPILKSQGIF